MANRFPLIANSSSNQIQELANADNLDLTGNNIVGVVNISASGTVSVGGTLTYEDVTNVDSVGLITARTGINVVAGVSTFKGANFNGGLLLREKINITAGKLSDNLNINLDNGMVHHFTTQEDATAIPNIMSSVGINTQMGTGDAIAVYYYHYSSCGRLFNLHHD